MYCFALYAITLLSICRFFTSHPCLIFLLLLVVFVVVVLLVHVVMYSQQYVGIFVLYAPFYVCYSNELEIYLFHVHIFGGYLLDLVIELYFSLFILVIFICAPQFFISRPLPLFYSLSLSFVPGMCEFSSNSFCFFVCYISVTFGHQCVYFFPLVNIEKIFFPDQQFWCWYFQNDPSVRCVYCINWAIYFFICSLSFSVSFFLQDAAENLIPFNILFMYCISISFFVQCASILMHYKYVWVWVNGWR